MGLWNFDYFHLKLLDLIGLWKGLGCVLVSVYHFYSTDVPGPKEVLYYHRFSQFISNHCCFDNLQPLLNNLKAFH